MWEDNKFINKELQSFQSKLLGPATFTEYKFYWLKFISASVYRYTNLFRREQPANRMMGYGM